MTATEAQYNGHARGSVNGHVLPHVPPEYASSAGLRNLEAEQALIGAALVDKKVLSRLPAGFDRHAFSDPLHRELFGFLEDRLASGETIDFASVGKVLRSRTADQ